MFATNSTNIIKKLVFVLVFLNFLICRPISLIAQFGDDESQMAIEMEKKLQEREPTPAEIVIEQIVKEEEKLPSLPGERIFIKRINVKGVTFISQEEVREITKPYENKELSLKQMQEIADQISNLYYKEGYPTSRAFVPIQEFDKEELELKVREGFVGEITIEGNKHFKEDFIRERIGLKEADPFNGHILRKYIHKLNKHPDRKIKVIVKPGQKPGFTDIVLKVKDRLPIHLIYEFNNYNSPSTEYRRYRLVGMHNNFTGHDDSLIFYDYRRGPSRDQDIAIMYYTLPIGERLKFDFYGLVKEEHYCGKKRLFLMEKRSYKTWFLLHYHFIEEEKTDLSAALGFIYKDVNMFVMREYMCRERVRAVYSHFNFDTTDDYGRTIISSDMEISIPDIWQGLRHDIDERACMPGMTGNWVYNRIYIARRQKLFGDLQLLLKPQFEISTDVLPGANRFSIGGVHGISDNRGYPRAELLGDSGCSVNAGLLFPPYIIPKNWNVPFTETKWHKALQLFAIYDYGYVWVRKPRNNEARRANLKSAGCGFRFKINDFSIRYDIGWPLGAPPSDNKRKHNWVQVMYDFHF
ncbi:MAG: ShlB/FhaC/HecB family hemolysin secretion/activation protein [Candidatus Omnitrophica bacterium]|nr:ShlB/FhaC/HecB family hemolysin secretion/activation protein [Candidatus Omnitrophota bacterium]